MAKKMQGPHIDGYFELNLGEPNDSLFVTIQAAPCGDSKVSATWWVSGLGELWMPYVLLKLDLTMQFTTQSQFEDDCKVLLESSITTLANASARAGGMVSPAPPNAAEVSEGLAMLHFEHHMAAPRLAHNSDSISTGTLYLMAKAFGVKNPVRFVSEQLDVSATTVTKRLTRYRDSGFIPKSRSN